MPGNAAGGLMSVVSRDLASFEEESFRRAKLAVAGTRERWVPGRFPAVCWDYQEVSTVERLLGGLASLARGGPGGSHQVIAAVHAVIEAAGLALLAHGIVVEDPHPGKVALLSGGRGSAAISNFSAAEFVSDQERLGLCRLLVAVKECQEGWDEQLYDSLKGLGFRLKRDTGRSRLCLQVAVKHLLGMLKPKDIEAFDAESEWFQGRLADWVSAGGLAKICSEQPRCAESFFRCSASCWALGAAVGWQANIVDTWGTIARYVLKYECSSSSAPAWAELRAALPRPAIASAVKAAATARATEANGSSPKVAMSTSAYNSALSVLSSAAGTATRLAQRGPGLSGEASRD
eukprot:gnl/TRDRNA2_/TRDRNA2_142231_c0_seq1.p1 gnl/TRDRNA2_/TRDRNA2_142231_c0~~gnl/TRDRNA2_/TRDRNA2_142231_c0_seq1.p1  ORF type:complete len:359 (-),score=60.17 gnl/TRDRNA2_/TRDRNA2_142231_c0_seq1:23-1063(-)